MLPANNITQTDAVDYLRLAKDALQATIEYVSTKVPTQYSAFEDKLFCIRPEKILNIMNSRDFSEYLFQAAANDPSGFDLKKALVTYHDKFFSKRKLYSTKLRTDQGTHEDDNTMNQDQIDKMLKWGIILSVIWLAGLGSLAAFIVGVKARNRIKASNGTLAGIGRAWWCLVAGALGLALWMPIILIGISNQF